MAERFVFHFQKSKFHKEPIEPKIFYVPNSLEWFLTKKRDEKITKIKYFWQFFPLLFHWFSFFRECYTAFLYLRRHANLILNLFGLMVDASVPDIALEPDKTVKKVQVKRDENWNIFHAYSLASCFEAWKIDFCRRRHLVGLVINLKNVKRKEIVSWSCGKLFFFRINSGWIWTRKRRYSTCRTS